MTLTAKLTSDIRPPFRWDEERRFLLRYELDAAFFHLYGINRDDAASILDTLPIVKRKDESNGTTIAPRRPSWKSTPPSSPPRDPASPTKCASTRRPPPQVIEYVFEDPQHRRLQMLR